MIIMTSRNSTVIAAIDPVMMMMSHFRRASTAMRSRREIVSSGDLVESFMAG